jgi:3-methyladenine DNA glycosylase AlkD
MSKLLADDIAAFLSVDEKYRDLRRLPDEFLERSLLLSGETVIQVALDLWGRGDQRNRWAAVTLLHSHPPAFRLLRWRLLQEMGDGMGNWGDTDAFSFLAGLAWRNGQISDQRVHRWARSKNRWWRRAALVCTVVLNRRSVGGTGDVGRTLAVAELLAGDRDDMVVKGLSWALRELIRVDRRAVERFLRDHDGVLAARVKREVRAKLTTGLKAPRSKGRAVRGQDSA